MNLTRCENGHFYDAERYDGCPHCNQTAISTAAHDSDGQSIYTVPMEQPGLTGVVTGVKSGVDGSQETIGFWGEIPVQPVVGWLVAIEGNNVGQDYKLTSGRNFIGRSSSMDISLVGDSSISRDKHAIILYDPKSNVFLVQPGDAKELFYLNDKVVLNVSEIKAYDVLSLGKTKLLFIPCCSDKFTWESIKEKEEEKK